MRRILFIFIIAIFFSQMNNYISGEEKVNRYEEIDRILNEAVKSGNYDTIWNMSKDPDPNVRIKACDGFLALGTERSKSKLVDMLFDIDPEVRRHSAELLTEIGWKPATDYTAIEYYIALRDWDRAVEYKESAIDQIATRLRRDTNSQIRVEAATALGKIPTQVSYNILEDVYRHDEDPNVRLTAYKSMQLILETIAIEKEPESKKLNKKTLMIGIIILLAIITTIIFLMPILRKKKEVKE
ncbi:MAG: HEAT repeat domain-containing protein [bacterium]